jgi:hypothetical protein
MDWGRGRGEGDGIGYWILGIGDWGMEEVREGGSVWVSGHGGLLLVILARPFGRFGIRCCVFRCAKAYSLNCSTNVRDMYTKKVKIAGSFWGWRKSNGNQGLGPGYYGG